MCIPRSRYERYNQYLPNITDRGWPQQFDTPDVSAFCSKRAFDGQIRAWRRFLHTWDEKPTPPGFEDEAAATAVDDTTAAGDLTQGEAVAQLFMIDTGGQRGVGVAPASGSAPEKAVAVDYASDSVGAHVIATAT